MTVEELMNKINGLPKDSPIMVRNAAGDISEAEEVKLEEMTSQIPKKCWLQIVIL